MNTFIPLWHEDMTFQLVPIEVKSGPSYAKLSMGT